MSNAATRKAGALTIVTFDAPGLGDRSYLLSDNEVCVVVDPQRDPSPYLQTAERLGVGVMAVLETHIHNDYLSGGPALAGATGATYVIPAGEPVSFAGEVRALDGGETLVAGRLAVTAIATAGHTAHHLAYLVELTGDEREEALAEQVVCTGGSLLHNATGRTDLLGPGLAETLARSQWRSVRLLLTSLPKHTRILPTHGFGSFCSATPAHGRVAAEPTIGHELEQNPAALLDEEDFVAMLLREPLPIPAYYRYMAPLNRKGPVIPTFEPVPELDEDALAEAIRGAEWVVDLRQRREYAAGHMPGTLNLELGENLTTYLGWIVPWEAELVLLAEGAEEIAEARRLIARIGREHVSGSALWGRTVSAMDPGERSRLGEYPLATFADLAEAWSDQEVSRPHVLDVRHLYEWKDGHLLGARHLALPELVAKRADVPTTVPVWVHCGAGFRAAAAASLLSGWGASPILIDDAWSNAGRTDLPIVTQGA
jgi:glyoxylase-like metal-dependent hydrolase (beta-lactamase superfamily II)/rhodanese-related sulfurtransferase